MLIIGGNINASIGTTTTKEEDYEDDKVTGRYGNNHRNVRGEKLRNFLETNELTSAAAHFPKHNHNTWSFAGNNENEK